jgi:hypothetical protein
MLTIDTRQLEDLQRSLRKLSREIESQTLNQAGVRALAETTREHLRDLDRSRPNALGGKRQNFYGAAAESIAEKADKRGGEIRITHQGFALRLYGGTVKPVKAKALAIPAMAKAYGLSPREPEVPELHARYFAARKAIGGLFDATGAVWFWLLPQTDHRPDPTLLPEPEALQTAAAEAMQDAADAILAATLGK